MPCTRPKMAMDRGNRASLTFVPSLWMTSLMLSRLKTTTNSNSTDKMKTTTQISNSSMNILLTQFLQHASTQSPQKLKQPQKTSPLYESIYFTVGPTPPLNLTMKKLKSPLQPFPNWVTVDCASHGMPILERLRHVRSERQRKMSEKARSDVLRRLGHIILSSLLLINPLK